jgi:type IV pilus assembly protein PilC
MAQIDLKAYTSNNKKPSPTAGGKNTSVFDILNKDIKLFGNNLSDKKKEHFYSELHILLSAGVDIKTALELIEEQQTKEADQILFRTIKEAVVNGGSISQAIHDSGKFSAYEYYSLQIGEESGRLSEVLQNLTVFFSKKIHQKRQIVNALSYPMIVLFTSFGAIFFMIKFVVPMFADVFKRFKGDLPALTKFIIQVSDVFSQYIFIFLLIIIATVVFFYVQRKTTWFRKHSANIILKLPIISNMVQKIYLARLCQSMNLLLSAKTPLVSALELVKKMVGFYPIEHSLAIIQNAILSGEPLYESMSKYSIYNKRMLSLIKVAEEVNQLDTIFEKLAKQYSDEVEYQTELLGSLIEPIMIIFLGLLVAVILISMYLPLFQLSTSIG